MTRILLAGIPPVLHEALRAELGREHTVLSLDGDVRDRETCERSTDCDVIVHGIPPHPDPLVMLDEAARGTWNLLTTTRATRYVLLSTMRLFDAYDPGWHITESWTPRPTPEPDVLASYLAEVASREVSRARPIACLALRLDKVVDGDQFARGPVGPEWLHLDDAVAALARAVTVELAAPDGARWVPLHIVRGDASGRFPAGRASAAPFGFSAQHLSDTPAPGWPTPAFPREAGPIAHLPAPERVVLFGAGGPLGAVLTTMLLDRSQLRLTDIRPLGEIAASPPQSEGAPLPMPETPAPHEEWVVDVTDPDAVLEAASGMDTIVNCTVMRHDPVQAFRVNTLGAFNVMRAAVEHGIRRVIQTGPVLTLAPHPAGYTEDREVGSDVPERPGDNLYFVSKLLGQEICRVFAEAHGIACPTLLFCGFVNRDVARTEGHPPGPFTVTWEDSGRAMAAAVGIRAMEAPFVVVHVMADAPHGRYRNDAVRRVLGWEPGDRLDDLWRRQA